MIIIDLLPYIVLLLLTLFLPQIVNNKQSMFFLFVVFLVFCGFRYGVGWDFFTYEGIVQYGGYGLERLEFLVRQLCYFCQKHDFVQFFFVATSFIILLCLFLMYAKESKNPNVSIFVFLCIPTFFLNSLTIVRFFLAVSMIFLSCHYAYEKKYIQYIGLLIMALLCHKAALFGVFTIPFVLTKYKFGLKVNLIVFVSCFIFGTVIGSFSFISSVFSNIMGSSLFGLFDIESGERYMQNIGNANFSRTPYVFALINLINLFSFQRKKSLQNETDWHLDHYVTMYNIGCSLMFLFSFHAIFANRLSLLFTIFLTLIVPFYKKNSIGLIAIYSICIFVFFYELTINATHIDFLGRQNCWLPYRMNFSF